MPDCIYLGKDCLGEAQRPGTCGRFSVVHRRDQADEVSIRAIARDGIRRHPGLTGVFAGNHPATALVPVENQLFVLVFSESHIRSPQFRKRRQISP